MTYSGGKNGAGIFQRIINQMPPHSTYIEAFLGSGAVLRRKAMAERNIGIDPSNKAHSLCLAEWPHAHLDLNLFEGSALDLLPTLETLVSKARLIDQPDTLIYADPPYVMETRKGGDLYDFELTDDDHIRLLEILTSARCMVMISGYRSGLYDEALAGWRRIDYMANTRQGMAAESLWLNFPEPSALHDYRYLGDDYRQRERIKRKRERWAGKFAKMDRLERLAVMSALTEVAGPVSASVPAKNDDV
ncbi:D12 class N6 adenine-specific DNA methyltransferase [Pelagimonas phthalicica]|uniref:site-specific DNA-methyltransferase (adenine-specific) n=1 Tax=Pelagimonas phthalicica TaxID=1037362 RepID=A0A238JG32_9RHOB|nr:DNA adenine methylase [Pelagimonas phthalicica]TDS92104.1 hypothetical protein CLV87_3287 [Pelagimonas phthalicica]SMX29154.1 D12 class N6 adenine-specific DNA methyltransferase [Pelagimonas phthalicica]